MTLLYTMIMYANDGKIIISELLYIWSIFALIVLAFQKTDSALLWAAISGAFGLSFGALCAIPYLISGGPAARSAKWR